MQALTQTDVVNMAEADELYEQIQVLREFESSPLAEKVGAALKAAARKEDFDIDNGIYSIPGMSGKKYRYFINSLIRSLPDARYLEVGSWAGSTLCSVIHDNKVWACAIDNWSLFGGPKELFMHNVLTHRSPQSEVTIIEADFRKVDYTQMRQGFNVYLFDGPHEKEDQYDGLAMALPCLDKQFVFIVDDWNWAPVRSGTLEAIEQCGLRILYSAQILTSRTGLQPVNNIGKKSNWHNGYMISVLEK